MREATENLKNEKWNIEKIYIPAHYMPPTGYGEIKITIYDGQITDCRITTSVKITSKEKIKKN